MSSKEKKPGLRMSIMTKMLLFLGGGVAVILISVSLLSLFGIPFTGIKGNYQNHRSEIIQKIDDVAQLKKEEIQSWFSERISHIRVFSESVGFDNIAERFNNGLTRGEDKGVLLAGIRNLEEYRAVLLRARSVLRDYVDDNEIRIVDTKTGTVIFSTNEGNRGLDLSEHEGIKNAMLPGVKEQVYFRKEKAASKEYLHIIYPIALNGFQGGEDMPSLAVMFILSPEELLMPILHTGTGHERSGEIILVDMNRTILSPLKYPLPGNRIAETLEYRLDTKPAELAAWGIDGIIFAEDYRGVPVIAAVRHMRITPEFGIGLIMKIDEEEVMAFARKSLKQSLLVSGLGLLIVLFLVYLFSGWITHPVIRLRRTAEKIMGGDLSARASVPRGDEVGFLAASFNSMVEEIQKWNEELETKVRQRTAELSLELTERKRAEEELQKYRDHLEDLVKERTVELEEAQEALVSIVEDLNEKTEQLAKATERAQSADRLKSAFLATMSHELRTPLNSIIGFTGIVLQGMSGPLNEEQNKQLTMVKGSANHLLDLINDVLDISKIEAGQVQITRKSFDMRSVIEAALRAVLSLAAKKGLSLESAIASDVGEIISDRRRVEQILINLVNNAVKFTEQGEVRIECRIHEGRMETCVRDTGIGIKPEDMGKLFIPFSQIENGLARRYEGTGLGLSICRKLAEMLGGTIRVDSEWGKGSQFTFTLPVGN